MAERIHVTVEELRLRNFRAFENARLTLSDLTFLVGRNGAGKTSILDAVELLRQAVTDSLENALDCRGGFLNVCRTQADEEANVSLGVAVVLRLRLPGGRQTRAIYGFELFGKTANQSREVRECLKLHPESASFFERRGEQFSSALDTGVCPPPGALVLPLIGRADSVWEAVYEAVRGMRAYELSPAAVAAPSLVGHRTNLETIGGNAGDVLKCIEDSESHRWVQRHLSALIPGIVSVRTEVILGRRVLWFAQEQAGVRREFDASQVSGGTLRGLAVLLALQQKPSPTVVLIDEVESSVHPSALAVLLDAAEASKDRLRIVFTTHSPEVLDHPAASGERLRIVEWHDGTSRIHRLNAETASAVSDLETVGSMLRSNALWPDEAAETWSGDLFCLAEPHA